MKVKAILSIVGRVLRIFLGVATLGATAATAYVVFAPDSLPKPFYLVYVADGAAPAGDSVTPTQEQTAAEPPKRASLINQVLGSIGIGGSQAETPTPEGGVATPEPESLSPGQGFMLNTGTKIVNLADAGGRRFLKATIVLELAEHAAVDPKLPAEERVAIEAEFTDTLNVQLPVINDALISLLSSKTFEAIYTVDGKEMLRQEIMDAVNTRLPEYQVIYVYFTDFVVE